MNKKIMAIMALCMLIMPFVMAVDEVNIVTANNTHVSYPESGAYPTTTSITFNTSDDTYDTFNCTVYVEDVVKASNESTANYTNTVIVASAVFQGDNSIIIGCCDDGDCLNSSMSNIIGDGLVEGSSTHQSMIAAFVGSFAAIGIGFILYRSYVSKK